MNDFENRKKLAQANLSRMFLYYNDFITEKQRDDFLKYNAQLVKDYFMIE